MKKENSALKVGFATAIASSLCCIAPIIAIVAGTSSIATQFSWIEPLRPYLIALTILAIGYAWYLNLKPVKADDCGCAEKSNSFFQKRSFLVIMTFFTAIMMAFPYYADSLVNVKQNYVVIENSENLQKVDYTIDGMTCTGCETHVRSEVVSKLDGIVDLTVSYESGIAFIEYDSSIVTENEIKNAVLNTGYTIKN